MKIGSSFKAGLQEERQKQEQSAQDLAPSFFGQGVEKKEIINGMEVFTVKTPAECPYDFSDRPQVCQYALRFNWAFSVGSDGSVIDRTLNDLYGFVQRNTGKVLLELSPNDCFCVGNAYALIALQTEQVNGQRAVNSVSAENAFFCFMHYYEGTGDKSVFPALFSLLYGPDDLLGDVLERSHAWFAYKSGTRSPFIGPAYSLNTNQFRNSAISFRIAVCKYLMDQVYDWDRGGFTIDKIGISGLLIPSVDVIDRFIQEFEDSRFIAMDYSIPGKMYLERTYKECEDLLKEF